MKDLIAIHQIHITRKPADPKIPGSKPEIEVIDPGMPFNAADTDQEIEFLAARAARVAVDGDVKPKKTAAQIKAAEEAEKARLKEEAEVAEAETKRQAEAQAQQDKEAAEAKKANEKEAAAAAKKNASKPDADLV